MTWFIATVLLIAAAPLVLWPLIRHWAAETPDPAREAERTRLELLDEIELDLGQGRLSREEAERWRKELR